MTNNITDSYKITPYLWATLPESPNYKNMIISKWLRSLKHGNDTFELTDSKSYYAHYSKYIESVLNRPLTVIRVAALVDDPDVALGFSVSEKQTLHYVHVHRDQRRQGIATALLPTKVSTITHVTHDGVKFWNKKFKSAIFNPF